MVKQIKGKAAKGGRVSCGGLLAYLIHKTIECLNHVSIVYESNVILRRVFRSSRDASTRGLNTHERRFKTI